MVKIRLMRVGKRKQPSYRVVVADSRSPRDGRIIEAIGHYHPRQDPSVVEIDNPRALHWLQLGAQPSNTVKNLLRITGAWSEFTGEAPPSGGPPAPKVKPKATAAASVSEETSEEAPEVAEEAVEAQAPEGVESGMTPEGPESVAEATEEASSQDSADPDKEEA